MYICHKNNNLRTIDTSTSSSVWLTLDEAAIKNNVDTLTNFIGRKDQICAVVKGNAYGHGLTDFAPLLQKNGIKRFAVYHAAEAICLRQILPGHHEIILLGLPMEDEIEALIDHDITCCILSMEDIPYYDAHATVLNPFRVHLKVDTGMNRFGVHTNEVQSAINQIDQSRGLRLAGVFSHFSNSWEVGEQSHAPKQLSLFKSTLNNTTGIDWKKTDVHLGNTAAIFNYPEAKFSYFRTGLGLCGYYPSIETKESLKDSPHGVLKPVLGCRTKLVSIKSVHKGEFIGYDASYETKTDMTIGIIPLGYSDGFPFSHSGKGSYVLINGQKAHVIGRVNMNALILDITSISSARRMQDVVLLGKCGNEEITLRNWMDWGATHLYESMTKMRYDMTRKFI